jgi:hypothetical protein
LITHSISLTNILPGLIVLLLEVVSHPPIKVGLSKPWVCLNCLGVIRDRPIILPFLIIAYPPIVEGLGKPWVYLLIASVKSEIAWSGWFSLP